MGRKKGAPQNDWSVYRQKDMGEIYEHNVAKYPLPPVGSFVIVMRRRTYTRGRGLSKLIKGTWEPDDNFIDACRVPYVYKVVEYKKGIEKPLDPQNAVCLEHTPKSMYRGYAHKKTIDTVRISIGYYKLLIVEDGEPFYNNIDYLDFGPDDLPVAEYTSEERKRRNRKDTD